VFWLWAGIRALIVIVLGPSAAKAAEEHPAAGCVTALVALVFLIWVVADIYQKFHVA
jgi:hypothetical protein